MGASGAAVAAVASYSAVALLRLAELRMLGILPARRHRLGRETADGAWRVGGLALDEPSHLSYPFVFEHEGYLFTSPDNASL